MCMRHTSHPASAQTPASSGSERSALTSLTSVAPAPSAARATLAFIVSIESCAPVSRSRSRTGTTRRRSSSASTGSAPGRVDSPPTSRIAAPSAASSRPCATASSWSSHSPPSENESGVTLTTPMTRKAGTARMYGGRQSIPRLPPRAGRLCRETAGPSLVTCRAGGWPAVAASMSLDLPPDELRALGHRVVDALVEHWSDPGAGPPLRTSSRAELDAVLREPAPEEPGSAMDALEVLLRDVLPSIQHADHPRFFARVPSPSNPVSALADALGAAFNAFAGSWAGGSGPSTLELVVLDWIRALCGLPAGGEGILLSGGSVSSLTALAAAGRRRLIASDQTHASVLRAARVLGMEVEVLASDDAFRLPAEAVAGVLRSDDCVAATAGTTNTGAIDPLRELAALCRDAGAWLHVDGAYGAPAALTPRGRALLDGLEEFDSLALDPHKWLFQPYECGCLLVREPDALTRTFHMAPEYLRDVLSDEVNFRDRGPQLTRGSRALKLWLSLKTFGAAAFRAGIERGIALAEHAEARLRDAGFEVVTPAQLAIVTFAAPEPDALADAMLRDGYAAPSTTVLRGRTVLRLCTLNPRTTEAEMDETVRRLASLA